MREAFCCNHMLIFVSAKTACHFPSQTNELFVEGKTCNAIRSETEAFRDKLF